MGTIRSFRHLKRSPDGIVLEVRQLCRILPLLVTYQTWQLRCPSALHCFRIYLLYFLHFSCRSLSIHF